MTTVARLNPPRTNQQPQPPRQGHSRPKTATAPVVFVLVRDKQKNKHPTTMASRDLTQSFIDRRNAAIRKRSKEGGGGST